MPYTLAHYRQDCSSWLRFPSFRPPWFTTDPRLDISVVAAMTTLERDLFRLLDPPSLELIAARAAVALDDVIRLRHHSEMLLPRVERMERMTLLEKFRMMLGLGWPD